MRECPVRGADALHRGAGRLLLRTRGRARNHHGQPDGLASDAALRPERRRQELGAERRRRAPSPGGVKRGAVRGAARDSASSSSGRGATIRLPRLERAIGRESGRPVTGEHFGDRLRNATDAVEGDLLVILDQFEEYFLYHSRRTGDGTFAVEFPRGGQPARSARELPRLDARGLDREARLLQGPHPEPLRQLPAHRSPRSRSRRARPSSGRSSNSIEQLAGRPAPMQDGPGARRDGAEPGHDGARCDRRHRQGPAREWPATGARTKTGSRRRTCSSS